MPRPTLIRSIARDDPDPGAIAEAAAILRSGGLVAFATETVYGLGADATDPTAVARIFAAKGRPATNPLIVHADGIERARSCVASWPDRAEALARQFWPGPLTLVLPRSEIIPDLVTAGRDTVAVRVPGPVVARRLIEATGRPIAAPSANRSTGVSPTQARHVQKDLEGRIDLILDSGPTAVGLESTVLDLSGPDLRLLRPGPISLESLREFLGDSILPPCPPRPGEAHTSPGQMAVHYSPRTPAVRIEPDRLGSFRWPSRFALLVLGQRDAIEVPSPLFLQRLATPVEAAESLYATLHDWDERGLDLIAIVPPPEREEWRAVRDRIWRATRSTDFAIPARQDRQTDT